MTSQTLFAEPLTGAAFAEYGDVIETRGAGHFPINAGSIERYHDLARVEPGSDGRVLISIVTCNQVATLPYRVPCIERHRLGSQAFIPLDQSPLLVVVAPAVEAPGVGQLRAFIGNGRQGVNYRPGVWHMPLICLDPDQRLLVVDRGGPEQDCEERDFDGAEVWLRR